MPLYIQRGAKTPSTICAVHKNVSLMKETAVWHFKRWILVNYLNWYFNNSAILFGYVTRNLIGCWQPMEQPASHIMCSQWTSTRMLYHSEGVIFDRISQRLPKHRMEWWSTIKNSGKHNTIFIIIMCVADGSPSHRITRLGSELCSFSRLCHAAKDILLFVAHLTFPIKCVSCQ